MRTNLEVLKKFTKDELVMRVEKLENSNTRLTSELQEFLIETKDVKVEELAMRLDLLMPVKWISDNYPNVEHIFSKMVELNQEWVEEVVNNGNHRLTDVLHDFSGIYGNFACPPEEKDEHFLPRIQAEEFNCEMCNKSMDEKEHDFSDICDDCREQDDSEDILGDFDENGDAVDVKVNGYTNIQTYRLCLVLDNEQVVPNPLTRFLELVQEDEFESNDIDIINWNEVIERYSDSILLEHDFYANK